jgi:toxin CcdB
MAQFDVYRNPRPTAFKRPYLVEVQGNLSKDLDTCVVIPLYPAGMMVPDAVLNPSIIYGDKEYILVTSQITSVARKELGRPIGSLSHYRIEIINSIDRMLA